MNKKEKELFKRLCSYKSEGFDEDLLNAATPGVLGQLFFNRMTGIAYGVLKNEGLLDKVNREFRTSLKNAYNLNIDKNESYFWCVQHLSNALSGCESKYAMLKGAYLCRYYPIGYRTSNDIDLLVKPKDVTEIGEALLKAGFKQGYIRNGTFEPATRKEIIESKMTKGETVPYIKEINYPSVKYLEVDVNFSLDYKPGATGIVEEMIKNSRVEKVEELSVRTLRYDDFFIHLCCHLHKEATTMPWIKNMRDMTLYKFCDIYTLLNDIDQDQVNSLFKRAYSVGLEKVCAFAVAYTDELFDFKNKYAVSVAKGILKTEPQFLDLVLSPKDKKKYIYTEKNICKRFFAGSRQSLLEEVDTNEKIKYETQQ